MNEADRPNAAGGELDRNGVDYLDAVAWAPALDRFASVTGLTISLFDARGERRAGPFALTPLASRLAEAGAWDSAKGVASKADAEAARLCMSTGRSEPYKGLDVLSSVAIPVRLDGQTIGAVTAGWVFDHFPDPIESDRLATRIGVPFPELWQIVRQQQPIGGDRLLLIAELLESFVESFAAQAASARVEAESSRALRVLNDLGLELAAAADTQGIGEAAATAAIALADAEFSEVMLDNGAHARRSRDGIDPSRENADASAQTVLRVPVRKLDGTGVGSVEVVYRHSLRRSDSNALETLAAQVAVALQKVDLLESLERERERLQDANRLKDEFLATVSHELRTPLNALSGWSQLLESGTLDESKTETAVETIARNVKALIRLVDDLLDVSRIVSGKLRLDVEMVDVARVLEAAVESMRPAADAKSIAFEIRVEPGVPAVLGDSARLQQVFWNLLSNAVKFTPERGRVAVALERVGTRIRLRVRDDGRGMHADFLPFAFDRLRQADGSTKRGYGGLGLGLAIVRHLVELHGGAVRAESDGEGLGATFTISLPVGGAFGDARRGDVQPTDESSIDLRLDGRRIVAVDDDDDGRELLVFALERRGAHVISVATAADAFDAVRRELPDALVSDIGLPGEDGFSLIRRLRQLDASEGGTVVAVAVTAYAGSTDRDTALESGFDAFMSKPFGPDELVQTVRALIARTSKQA